MKLWKLHYHLDDTPSGNVAEWFTSKRAADLRARELHVEYPDGASSFQLYTGTPSREEVPTTKAALAAWLTWYVP